MRNFLTGFSLLITTIFTIIFAYYITLIIGKKTSKLMNNRHIKILERTTIGLNTNITIVKINKKVYIIALQGKNIQVIDAIDENNWDFSSVENQNQMNSQEEPIRILKNKFFKK